MAGLKEIENVCVCFCVVFSWVAQFSCPRQAITSNAQHGCSESTVALDSQPLQAFTAEGSAIWQVKHAGTHTHMCVFLSLSSFP